MRVNDERTGPSHDKIGLTALDDAVKCCRVCAAILYSRGFSCTRDSTRLLMNQITSKLQVVRGKVGQPLIKGEAEGLNLAKYKLQKSLIEPAKLKEALIKAVDEKYLKPALRAYNIPHGGVNYLGLNLET